MPRGRPPSKQSVPMAEVKYLCPYCNKQKNPAEFYTSSDPLMMTGKTVMCKSCAEKIARNYNERTKTYGDCTKASVQEALERLDKPYLEEIWNASYNEYTNESAKLKRTNIWASYIKNIAMPQYRTMRWRDGDLYSNYREMAIKQARKELREASIPPDSTSKVLDISEEYEKNKEDVIRLLGYDPFESELESDKPLLYSQLIGYLDLGGDNEDMMRVSSAITIVRGFLQQAKIDDMIANDMSSPNVASKTGEIKTLLDSKQKISSTISQLAEQSCLSLKHNKNASKGENTFTGKTKRLKEMNLREMENNAFDVGTCEGMRQVADISHASILKQIHLDENDYTEMLAEQREMIVRLQREADEAIEKARVLLRENIDLKKFIEGQGIDISENLSEKDVLMDKDEGAEPIE